VLTDLDRLEALLREGTPGPWWDDILGSGTLIRTENRDHVVADEIEDAPMDGRECHGTQTLVGSTPGDTCGVHDAALIVAAVNSLPSLIVEVRRLREVLTEFSLGLSRDDQGASTTRDDVERWVKDTARAALGADR